MRHPWCGFWLDDRGLSLSSGLLLLQWFVIDFLLHTVAERGNMLACSKYEEWLRQSQSQQPKSTGVIDEPERPLDPRTPNRTNNDKGCATSSVSQHARHGRTS